MSSQVVNSYGGSNNDNDVDGAAYLNVYAPFCVALVGIQGAGKSHTTNVILENCLLEVDEDEGGYDRSVSPMSALIFHYDNNGGVLPLGFKLLPELLVRV